MGNLNAQRDWGHAKDYVEGMWKMLQQDIPEDFVLSTGKTTTVREFVKLSFLELGFELEFKGEEENEIGVIKKCTGESVLPIGKTVVKIDKNYFRPTEVDLLIGDSTKAKEKLSGVPKIDLKMIVKERVEKDYNHFEYKK